MAAAFVTRWWIINPGACNPSGVALSIADALELCHRDVSCTAACIGAHLA
jgi:hypothetical protein